VAVNVVDSFVLASDSATTHPNGIWNSANKIFNLRKTWPVAAATFGVAALGGQSIASLSKELRCRFSGQRSDHNDWSLDPAGYQIADVAERLKDFFYAKYQAASGQETLGFYVAGYSAGSDEGEAWLVTMDKNGCIAPVEQGKRGEAAVSWAGQPEAVSRIVNGASMALPQALTVLGMDPAEAASKVEAAQKLTGIPLAVAGMPLGEAIDLAEFLVDATIKFVRFGPGNAATVGGPVEIAALTRHEGFKWIKRKHHYPQSLNVVELLP
jgi:hypothetical protein